jgi:M6 family metalloprotease-like protein
VSEGRLSIALKGDEAKAYLVVCATPDTLKNYNVDWDSSATDVDTRYTYKVKLEATNTSVLYGDVNLDGSVEKSDAALLLRYLSGLEGLDADELANADCDGTAGIDLRDAQWILNYNPTTTITTTTTTTITTTETTTETTTAVAETDALVAASVDKLSPTTPSVGDVKMLVFYVDFPNTTYTSDAYSMSQMKDELFGNSSAAYPYDSVTAWYSRASYGNLNITGDVYAYTCQNNMSTYQSDEGVDAMLKEVLSGLDSQINYADYDSDNDGYIDCISITVPLDNADDDTKSFWYGRTCTWGNTSCSVDGKKVKQYVITDVTPVEENMDYLKQTMMHEMGHSMGLPDFYKYYSGTDWNGFNGDAGYSRMDDSIGDFCGFAKLMYGWLRESEVQSYTGSGTQTFTLEDAATKGSCLILPISSTAEDYNSEYFLIEYVTDAANNSDVIKYTGEHSSGVRIFHIQAELASNWWSTYFKYDNFSDDYDVSDSKQRVARLVNDGNGFYQSGAQISYGTSGFAAYDTDGNQSVDTGYSISIDSISNGKCTVTVSKN